MDEKKRSKVKVVVRLRPQLKKEGKICLHAEQNKVHIVNHRNKEESLQYDFSSVYGEAASQQTVFSECVEPLLHHAFQGQNVSVFAYGPTGAGKTHTMLGMVSDPGIIPRTVKTLFKMRAEELASSTAAGEPLPTFTISFSYMEIYNEKVQDLLKAGNSDLPIREDASHNIFVSGITEKVIDDFNAFKDAFGPASSNRTVASTKLNENSSRSHSILLIKVLRSSKGRTYRGKVYLIDLAGSEDNRRTGNAGIRMKESAAINKSLFVLGEVVDAINQNHIRIPYRNSKLTRLLQDSIGGSCHSVMITNIAPEQHYYYDSYCTLNFATKSKKIVNVNTVAVKDKSPAITVPKAKPTAQLQPKRRSTGPAEGSKAKRVRRESSSGSSKVPHLPTKKEEHTENVLPSPMVRRQAEFESSVNEKLARLERIIKSQAATGGAVVSSDSLEAISQIKQDIAQSVSSQPKPSLTKSTSTPVLHPKPQPRARVAVARRKSARLDRAAVAAAATAESTESSTPPPAQGSPEMFTPASHHQPSHKSPLREANLNVASGGAAASGSFVTRGRGSSGAGELQASWGDSGKPLDANSSTDEFDVKGKQNLLYQRLFKKQPMEKTKKRLMNDDGPSFSPLFASENPKKRSVAVTPLVAKLKMTPAKFEHDEQTKRSSDFLDLINSGSIKDLQNLQLIGKKKAQLIFDYREANGPFDFVESLKNVFTEKFMLNLLKANMVTKTKT